MANELPKLPDGTVDVGHIKELYDDSRHLDWVTFAESQGWHTSVARERIPHRKWLTAKKRRISKAHSLTIENLDFEYLDLWSRDILKTMRDYPRTIDMIHNMLLQKIGKIYKNMQTEKGLESTDTKDLRNIAMAITTLTTAKHKSLCIDNLTINRVREERRTIKDIQQKEKDQGTDGFKFNIIGYPEGIKADQIRSLYDQFLDNPDKLEKDQAAIRDAENHQIKTREDE